MTMRHLDGVLFFGAFLANVAWMTLAQDLQIPTLEIPVDPNRELPFFTGEQPEQLVSPLSDRKEIGVLTGRFVLR